MNLKSYLVLRKLQEHLMLGLLVDPVRWPLHWMTLLAQLLLLMPHFLILSPWMVLLHVMLPPWMVLLHLMLSLWMMVLHLMLPPWPQRSVFLVMLTPLV